nr:uncharacterized protein LOC105879471 [Microcebus murinus]
MCNAVCHLCAIHVLIPCDIRATVCVPSKCVICGCFSCTAVWVLPLHMPPVCDIYAAVCHPITGPLHAEHGSLVCVCLCSLSLLPLGCFRIRVFQVFYSLCVAYTCARVGRVPVCVLLQGGMLTSAACIPWVCYLCHPLVSLARVTCVLVLVLPWSLCNPPSVSPAGGGGLLLCLCPNTARVRHHVLEQWHSPTRAHSGCVQTTHTRVSPTKAQAALWPSEEEEGTMGGKPLFRGERPGPHGPAVPSCWGTVHVSCGPFSWPVRPRKVLFPQQPVLTFPLPGWAPPGHSSCLMLQGLCLLREHGLLIASFYRS